MMQLSTDNARWQIRCAVRARRSALASRGLNRVGVSDRVDWCAFLNANLKGHR